MLAPRPVFFHPTEWPEAATQRHCLAWQQLRFPPKFHYLTHAQATRWLHLHQTYSPSRNDPACLAAYRAIFDCAATALGSGPVQLCGLGSGGGTKDSLLLEALHKAGARYVPCDASPTLALTSAARVETDHPRISVRPLVADLEAMDRDETFWREGSPAGERQIFSFLGMVPNLEPGPALRKLAAWSRPDDLLIVSANLAPGPDYAAGCRTVLPQYENPETESWLRLTLENDGLRRDQVHIHFTIEPSPADPRLLRIVARATAREPIQIPLPETGSPIHWEPGQDLELFFSNRFTPDLFEALLTEAGWHTLTREIIPSGQEAVWLATRASSTQAVAKP